MDEYISIIIAAYNSQKWLARCLDSVLAAADDSCEIIIVDDGSTDQTLSIAEDYENEDGRITVYSIDHSGMSVARKYGVQMCNGDSVMFVDCDDTLPINAIVEMRNASKPDCDIVCCNIILHDVHGNKRRLYSGANQEMSGIEYARLSLQRGFASMTLGKKFARYLFDITQWDTDETMSVLNARVLLLRLACAASRVSVMPTAVTYNYIVRENSLSAMFSLQLDGIERAWNYVKELPLPQKELTEWGLDLLNHTLLQRGFPFDNNYAPAMDMRRMAKTVALSSYHKAILKSLKSERYRLRMARHNVYVGALTLTTPHVSFVVVINNNANEFKRTVKSIIRTGLRNIEIIAIDDGSNRKTSIELSTLAIRFPRIVLRRNPVPVGMAQSRRLALSMAHGSSVFFVDPGDCVDRHGVFEAALLIDNGADLAYFGVDSKMPYLPFRWRYFVPSKCDILQEGIDKMFESHVSRGYLNDGLRAIAMSRRFITTDMMCERGVKYGSGYVSMLNILMAKPKIAQTDACGYINCKRVVLHDRSYKHLCRLDVELSLHTLRVLLNAGIDKEHAQTLVAQGSFNSLCRIMAAVMSNPFKGMDKAMLLAQKLQCYRLFNRLYRNLEMEPPTVDAYLEHAKQQLDGSRWSFLIGSQENY